MSSPGSRLEFVGGVPLREVARIESKPANPGKLVARTSVVLRPLVVLCLGLTGCASGWTTVQPGVPLEAAIAEADRVQATLEDGSVVELHDPELRGSTLAGSLRGPRSPDATAAESAYSVPMENVATLRAPRRSWKDTTVFVALTTLVILVVVAMNTLNEA